MKKLREVLRLKAIASYYIKTLFLWKIYQNPKQYWETKLSTTFKVMVEELYNAIRVKNIPYFWNAEHNLISGLKDTLQNEYCEKLKRVLDGIESNDLEKVLAGLLTVNELSEFKTFACYQAQPSPAVSTQSVEVNPPNDNNELLRILVKKMEILTKRVDDLTEKVDLLNLKTGLL